MVWVCIQSAGTTTQVVPVDWIGATFLKLGSPVFRLKVGVWGWERQADFNHVHPLTAAIPQNELIYKVIQEKNPQRAPK